MVACCEEPPRAQPSDTPASILNDTAREFGRFKMVLLWVHAFEEPFYTYKDFELLARPTLFKEGQTRFVGALCCLALKREDLSSGDAVLD